MGEIYDICFSQVAVLAFQVVMGFHIPTCQNYFSVRIYIAVLEDE